MAKRQITNLSEAQKLFKEALEDMGKGGRHLRDIFDDFLFMASTALRQSAHVFKTGKADAKLEEGLQVLKKHYAVPNEFGKAFGILTMALGMDPHDFLGEFYGAIDAHNARTGQFFTPGPVAAVMARVNMTRDHYESVLARGDRFSVQEPACGAGCMAIECAKMFREWEAHPSTWYVDCTDIDLRCVRMTYIQLSLLGVPAFVRHGNTLSLEQWDCWPTLTMAMNPFIPGRMPARASQTGQQGASLPERTSTIRQQASPSKSPPEQRRILRLGRSA